MPPMRVLVTGASAGIGRDTALACARLGFEVFAAARRTKALDALREEAGPSLRPIELDVNDGASIERARDAILGLTDGYGVDGLVNNAGIAIAGALAEVTDRDMRAQFETNVFGLMTVTRAFLPPMMQRRRGRIVNVSSSGGLVSLPFVGVYHATKFALEALSDALRWELSPFGIRVSLIEPGPIRTEFGDKLVGSTDRILPGSPYAPIFADIERIKAFAEARMSGTAVVTRDIVHALSSRWPRARYLEPRLMIVLIKAYQLAPTWLSDWVITRVTGLTATKLLSPSAAKLPPSME
jgi:NAD(P)-dependent dehydrogenase (short-subunit alcohol dehydrogenase family)